MPYNFIHSRTRFLLIVVVIAVAIIISMFLNAPDRRTPSERLNDAVEELSEGVNDAGRELKPRTPREKLEDEAEDLRD